jgi:hypothetical protein
VWLCIFEGPYLVDSAWEFFLRFPRYVPIMSHWLPYVVLWKQFLSKIVSTLRVSYLETINLGALYSDPMCSRIILQNQGSIFAFDVLEEYPRKIGACALS